MFVCVCWIEKLIKNKNNSHQIMVVPKKGKYPSENSSRPCHYYCIPTSRFYFKLFTFLNMSINIIYWFHLFTLLGFSVLKQTKTAAKQVKHMILHPLKLKCERGCCIFQWHWSDMNELPAWKFLFIFLQNLAEMDKGVLKLCVGTKY